jgi:hypothetical protein
MMPKVTASPSNNRNNGGKVIDDAEGDGEPLKPM